MGEYDQALSLFEEALEIREKILGTDHPDTAISLNNLAIWHESVGNYDQALELFLRALATFSGPKTFLRISKALL